jgi:hypothetical protein
MRMCSLSQLGTIASFVSIVASVGPVATADEPESLLPGKPNVRRYRPGDFVVVTCRAELKVESKTLEVVDEGLLLGVDRVEGDWLWVTSKKSGWLNSGNVIPAKEAIDYFSTAIGRNPNGARWLARRGLARALNQDFAGALKDYNEALRLKPTEAVYYGDRGCIFLALGDWERATADFNEELKRIATEDQSKREIREQWLQQRLADAQAIKSQDTTVTLGDSP